MSDNNIINEDGPIEDEGVWVVLLSTSIDITISVAEQINLIYKYGSIADCNLTMAKMYRHNSAASIIGTKIGEILPPVPANLDYLSEFIANNYKISDAESREIDIDGRPVYFLNSMEGLFDSERRLIGARGKQREIKSQDVT